jgi:hypothetical protein
MTVLQPTASIIPAGVLSRRLRLSPGPAAVGQARARVRAAVRDWQLPVSEGMAVLLTWDLVTSVTTEGPGGANGTEGPAGPMVAHAGGPAAGGFLSLGISAWRGMLRVDVYDGRRSLPARGYEIVASLADDWGIYRTPAGRAVFFTLRFPGAAAPDAARTAHRASHRSLADTSAD